MLLRSLQEKLHLRQMCSRDRYGAKKCKLTGHQGQGKYPIILCHLRPSLQEVVNYGANAVFTILPLISCSFARFCIIFTSSMKLMYKSNYLWGGVVVALASVRKANLTTMLRR